MEVAVAPPVAADGREVADLAAVDTPLVEADTPAVAAATAGANA